MITDFLRSVSEHATKFLRILAVWQKHPELYNIHMDQNSPAHWRVKTKERNMLLCPKHADYYMKNGFDVEKLPDGADVGCEECSASFANG